MEEQANLAKNYGIDGFNFYFYWFNGRRILEKPIENFLASEIDISFSLTWANENWTRRWNGSEKEILLKQNYEIGFEEKIFADLLPFFQDPRYVKVDGKPLLSIYRAQEIPKVKEVLAHLRELAVDAGFPGLQIVAVESFNLKNPKEVGADAMMEFPPHGFGESSLVPNAAGTQHSFMGNMFEYSKAAICAALKKEVDFTYYRGVMPGWDNTARAGLRSNLFLNNTPAAFENWLVFAISWNAANFRNEEQPFVFVNAWNEWAEGAHLEPDLKHGHAFLRAIKRAINQGPIDVDQAQSRIRDSSNSHQMKIASNRPVTSKLTVEIVKIFVGQIRLTTFRHVLRILKADPTGRQLVRVVRNFLASVLQNEATWGPNSFLDESSGEDPDFKNLLISCHIHYPEYTERLIALVENLSPEVHFAVTSDDPGVLTKINSHRFSNVSTALSSNRGRNFGPLLVEFGKQMLKFKYVVHLHSKKSLHSGPDFGRIWSDSHWKMLAENPRTLARTLNLMDHDEELAVAYPLVTEIIKPYRFNWFSSKHLAEDWFIKSELDFVEEPFAFPAGGMFMIRTSAYAVLLEKEWSYNDFPEETGQLDGTTQHLIERLIGAIPISKGQKHLIYAKEFDKFTSDISFPKPYLGQKD